MIFAAQKKMTERGARPFFWKKKKKRGPFTGEWGGWGTAAFFQCGKKKGPPQWKDYEWKTSARKRCYLD